MNIDWIVSLLFRHLKKTEILTHLKILQEQDLQMYKVDLVELKSQMAEYLFRFTTKTT